MSGRKEITIPPPTQEEQEFMKRYKQWGPFTYTGLGPWVKQIVAFFL